MTSLFDDDDARRTRQAPLRVRFALLAELHFGGPAPSTSSLVRRLELAGLCYQARTVGEELARARRLGLVAQDESAQRLTDAGRSLALALREDVLALLRA